MQDKLEAAIRRAGRIVLGKEHQMRLALTCLLARGHLLIEDIPGVGKTTLAHTLAVTLGLQFNRVQFTADLLPADILGASVFEPKDHTFRFHPGPIFSQVVLADEVNRATPKTQSALLEAMEEQQVTIDGASRPLPRPFFVIATQNPSHQIGTYSLPESQLDRFLMRIELGYPSPSAERGLLEGRDRRELMTDLSPATDATAIRGAQHAVSRIHASPALLDYLQALLTFSRDSSYFLQGLSPRAGLALLNSARAWAFLHGRDYVRPEDLQHVLPHVVDHRLEMTSDEGPGTKISSLFKDVAIP